jgi:hypothetical protein
MWGSPFGATVQSYEKLHAIQSLAASLAPHFSENVKVSYVSMKLPLAANRIGNFLKQLDANMTQQSFAIVDDPAALRTRAGLKMLFHPGSASSHKLRFGFRGRFGFSAEPVTHLSQSTVIARLCQANADPGHRPNDT